jgi:hypothetical protein
VPLLPTTARVCCRPAAPTSRPDSPHHTPTRAPLASLLALYNQHRCSPPRCSASLAADHATARSSLTRAQAPPPINSAGQHHFRTHLTPPAC